MDRLLVDLRSGRSVPALHPPGTRLAERAHQSIGRIVTRNGIEFHVEEYSGAGFRSENVAFELGGVWFEISSDLPLGTILDVALSIGEGP